MKQLALDITRPPAPLFDNFIVGTNEELLAQLRTAIAGSGERFIYLWGEPGSGRTHLLKSAVAAAQSVGASAAYVQSGAHVLFDGVESLLAVDDVQNLDADAQIALFNRYNQLKESGGALIAAGDLPPMRLNLRADLVTRLGWGLVYEVHALSDEQKARALSRHAAARGFTLPDEVVAYLLTHAPRGMGELFALLDALDRHSLETKRAVTVPLLRELLVG